MRVMSLIRIWFALMVCIILCVGFFLTLKYSTISKAERRTVPYKLLYTKQSNIPYSNATNNEKKVIKGMLITKASNPETLLQIAETIKDQYTSKEIDEIILTIHNENNGNYEEELPYEPISKGKIIVTYDSKSFGSTNIILNE
ncbi:MULTISPECIES: hypothetical protein [Bacillus]|uniref:Uncharacterized protein n=2 Tax=Bacillus cereus group TaxID=86661 RepID=A0A2A7D6Z3_BACAN|nr:MULTISPECIES: hypothetical protein [Bacillus]MCP1162812.1 hypothetical protein [Bacillus sp. 1813sda1]MDC7974068.1 hypothetical protein [Bacillus sp. BLCC-B18]OTW68075.1 hypothetical protein BK707_23300 [Bacillus thuringiensis serovar coreanensis]OTX44692.1 hypothetical protein BK724_18595 [Bacillus thuringiensis serovar sooncheon]OTX53856.1 hypothetical protein BK725_16980 [Bacillus thuringiensis serovar guiyangiensis]